MTTQHSFYGCLARLFTGRSILIALIVLVAFVAACNKESRVKADFSTDPLVPKANERFTLKNQSENATKYLWRFSNGQTSTDKDPSVTMPASGTMTVYLRVESDCGYDEITKSIPSGTVINSTIKLPIANFMYSFPACNQAPATVQFKSTAQNATSIKWLFASGSPATSADSTLSVTFPTASDFKVTLTVTGSNGQISVKLSLSGQHQKAMSRRSSSDGFGLMPYQWHCYGA